MAATEANEMAQRSFHPTAGGALVVLTAIGAAVLGCSESTTAPSPALTPQPAYGTASAGGVGPCDALTVPVALAPGLPTEYVIYGELCRPQAGPGRVVQVLVHGATYGHVYWDFPLQPQLYSYVRAATAGGYSTFNIDRIGVGRSSHPPSTLVTVTANAYVVHQLVQGLRSGNIGGLAYSRVELVGHSLGSAVSWVEAGTYHDVDGVIISGLLHKSSPSGTQLAFASIYPANQDPRFAGRGLDSGYLTTQPGTRGRIFYYSPTADPQVIATDEATKETVTSTELSDLFAVSASGISAQIDVPVLVVVGQYDRLYCGADATDCSSAASVLQAEAPFYSPQAQLQAVVIPSTGHDLNLHYTAQAWYAQALAWSLTRTRKAGALTLAGPGPIPRPASPVLGLRGGRLARAH